MSLQLVTLPLRAIRAPIKVLLLPGESHRTKWHLPVAGLDEEQAQDILFALRRAGSGDEVRRGAGWSVCGGRFGEGCVSDCGEHE